MTGEQVSARVFKWAIGVWGVEAPGEPLYIDVQHGRPFLWTLVADPGFTPKDLRQYRSYGTGHPVPDDVGRHIGSFLLDDGALVFHVFQVPEGTE